MTYNGGQLFLLFVKQRLQADHPEMVSQITLLSDFKEPENEEFKCAYKDLQRETSHFLKSKQRQMTKDEAMAHSLDIREQDFKSIVEQVLAASPENLVNCIVVVFFFMYDFIMRMYTKGVANMGEVLGWSQKTVVEEVDPKVTQAGGWVTVFKQNQGQGCCILL
ncbi:uncharacterized protein LOC131940007 [Physella acuta]|uniref:uncharacterized protein LOC131940007 n=1 Tax=Physella acuta TaxID=109671 RepID=UPI0027DAD947|nr:uncharacterized protein LOC131940007 [Physella acuta]